MKTKLAYLAGIIDGEGTINCQYFKARKEYRLRLYVVNTDKKLIDWLHNNFGGYVYLAKRHKLNHPNWKDKYEWIYVPSKDDKDLIKSLIPYLVIKKEQMVLFHKFLKTKNKSGQRLSENQKLIRIECYTEIRRLNGYRVAAETK